MATAEITIPTGTYTLDPVHSSIGFGVKHMVVSTFRGTFADYDASLTVGEDGLPVLTGTVAVGSIETKDPNLTGHLLSPDFFDVERHPEIVFQTRSSRLSDGGDLVIDGELTINGITRAVEARGTLNYADVVELGGGEKVGIDLETVVDRNEFGLKWNAPLPKGGFALDNDVKLQVELEFTKVQEA